MLSASVPARVIALAVSSSVVTDWAVATGTSFTLVITIDTVATDEVRPPATTRKVKLSAPVRFRVGV